MDDRKLLGIGIGGALVAALCCFTPALVLLLGAVGLSALVGWWLDLVLLPTLAVFLGIAVYAIVRQQRPPPAAKGTGGAGEGSTRG